ncbi:hypothetical protein GMRT_14666 [Giardia muris]|uniref:Uncharacterized protein n=1 Tax=Giardia muris TaxID=5742 RepID=A0A4Z1T1K4_GIAMU|nr:hypothetical protein GMRT_14666 [Giardia muris]|eukprot:TNJ26419.1 hypothetical protein GMRT_14666 [Giardia muris]
MSAWDEEEYDPSRCAGCHQPITQPNVTCGECHGLYHLACTDLVESPIHATTLSIRALELRVSPKKQVRNLVKGLTATKLSRLSQYVYICGTCRPKLTRPRQFEERAAREAFNEVANIVSSLTATQTIKKEPPLKTRLEPQPDPSTDSSSSSDERSSQEESGSEFHPTMTSTRVSSKTSFNDDVVPSPPKQKEEGVVVARKEKTVSTKVPKSPKAPKTSTSRVRASRAAKTPKKSIVMDLKPTQEQLSELRTAILAIREMYDVVCLLTQGKFYNRNFFSTMDIEKPFYFEAPLEDQSGIRLIGQLVTYVAWIGIRMQQYEESLIDELDEAFSRKCEHKLRRITQFVDFKDYTQKYRLILPELDMFRVPNLLDSKYISKEKVCLFPVFQSLWSVYSKPIWNKPNHTQGIWLLGHLNIRVLFIQPKDERVTKCNQRNRYRPIILCNSAHYRNLMVTLAHPEQRVSESIIEGPLMATHKPDGDKTREKTPRTFLMKVQSTFLGKQYKDLIDEYNARAGRLYLPQGLKCNELLTMQEPLTSIAAKTVDEMKDMEGPIDSDSKGYYYGRLATYLTILSDPDQYRQGYQSQMEYTPLETWNVQRSVGWSQGYALMCSSTVLQDAYDLGVVDFNNDVADAVEVPPVIPCRIYGIYLRRKK